MAVPINILISSPHESSDEENNDSEVSYSSEDETMEDEPSELENTNGGSSSSLFNLSREVTEPNGTEDEFWIKYPYLKEAVAIVVTQGLIPANDAFERIKLIGDEKAKELNDAWKALCIKEQDLFSKKLDLLAFAMNPDFEEFSGF